MRRMAPKPWIDPDALGRLEAGANPLADICGRARAERRGEVYTPEPAPQVIPRPPVELPSVHAAAPPAVALVPTSLSPAFVVGANRQLSGAAFKVLMAIAAMGDGCYTAMQLANATRTHRDTILKAVVECLDYGWLDRSVLCSLCETEGEIIDDGRHIACSRCRRNVPVKHSYRVLCPLELVAENNRNPAVIFLSHTEENRNPAEETGRVGGEETTATGLKQRAARIAAEMAANPAEILRNPLRKKPATPAVIYRNLAEETGNPRPRTESDSDSDSDSESNITNDSDSEYMRNGTGNGNGIGKSEVEQLAQASCKALETGSGSLGMHIKAWAHARQLDAKTGGKSHQTAIAAIQRELAAQRKETGQVQGKAWTRRVVDYFEGQGVPLMTGRKS